MKEIKNEHDGKKSLHGIRQNGIRRNGIRQNGKTPFKHRRWPAYVGSSSSCCMRL